jgi:hypothetical protein
MLAAKFEAETWTTIPASFVRSAHAHSPLRLREHCDGVGGE